MKLKILLLVGIGVAGLGASYALADAGHGRGKPFHEGKGASCRRTVLLGTAEAPQTLTVTVTRAGRKSPFTSGQAVAVQLGSTGQSVRVNVVGCADGSTLTANGAVLQVVSGKHGHGNHGTTTVTTTVTTEVAPAPKTESQSTETETDTTPTTDTGTSTDTTPTTDTTTTTADDSSNG